MSSKKPMLLARLALVAFSTLLALVVGEIALRGLGKKTGYVPRYSRFRPVDQLEVDDSYVADSDGVFKANPNHQWPDGIQINSDGFRSAELSQYENDTRTKILFLGDSFTWGSSARPITECFVDRVSRAGFATFNTGISGADPTQYAFLAEKYVPTLKPDVVATMFYIGNDFKPDRPMLPYKRLFHPTNSKMFYAFDAKGNYMTAQEAYERYLAKSNAAAADSSPQSFKARVRDVFMKTVIGTYCWVAVANLKKRVADEDAADSATSEEKYWDTNKQIARIKKVCEDNGTQFMLFVIPVHPEKVSIYTSVEHSLPYLEEFDPLIPDFLVRSDYMDLPNAHLNNSGHEKYAEFIVKSVNESILAKGTN